MYMNQSFFIVFGLFSVTHAFGFCLRTRSLSGNSFDKTFGDYGAKGHRSPSGKLMHDADLRFRDALLKSFLWVKRWTFLRCIR